MGMEEELRLLDRLRQAERQLERSQEYVKKLESKLRSFEAQAGEQFVKTGMNRQGRVKGSEYWIDFHAATFEQVARTLAIGVGADRCDVEVRDMSEPDLVRQFTVQRIECYRVVNLRGGADKEPTAGETKETSGSSAAQMV